jgi:hypothetical protein
MRPTIYILKMTNTSHMAANSNTRFAKVVLSTEAGDKIVLKANNGVNLHPQKMNACEMHKKDYPIDVPVERHYTVNGSLNVDGDGKVLSAPFTIYVKEAKHNYTAKYSECVINEVMPENVASSILLKFHGKISASLGEIEDALKD